MRAGTTAVPAGPTAWASHLSTSLRSVGTTGARPREKPKSDNLAPRGQPAGTTSRGLTSTTQIANAESLHQLFDNRKRLSPYSARFCHVSPYYSKILREFCAKPIIRKDRGGRGRGVPGKI